MTLAETPLPYERVQRSTYARRSDLEPPSALGLRGYPSRQDDRLGGEEDDPPLPKRRTSPSR